MGVSIIPAVNSVDVNQVDPTTNSLKVLDYAHAELHSGDHFAVRNFELVAKNATKDILIVTPDTARWAHMVIGLESASSVVVGTLYEATVTSSDGTLDGARNRNRNFPDDNTTLVYEDPTVTTVGDLIYTASVGSGRNIGGGARDSEEIILKQNTKYLFRMTEQNVVATVVNWVFDWYEHTNN